VPKELLANGNKLIGDAAGDPAFPANTGSQRLVHTKEPSKANHTLK